MAKVKFPLFSGDVQGQLGKMLIFTRGGRVRKYFVPRDPKTPAQLAAREAFKEMVMSGFLTQEQADLLYAALEHVHEGDGGGGGEVKATKVYPGDDFEYSKGVVQVMNWGAVNYASDGMWNASAPTRLKATATGLWRVECGLMHSGLSSGIFSFRFKKNGIAYVYYVDQDIIISDVGPLLSFWHEEPLVVNDYVEVEIFTQGSGPFWVHDGVGASFFSMRYLGVVE